METAEFAYHEPGNETRPPCITEDAYYRGTVAVKIEIDVGKYIWYVSTHLGPDSIERKGDASQLVDEFVPSLSKPYKVAFFVGYFNAKPGEDPIKTILAAGYTGMWTICGKCDGFTFSS